MPAGQAIMERRRCSVPGLTLDGGDGASSSFSQKSVQSTLSWDREWLRLFGPFRELDLKTMMSIEKHLQYLSIPTGSTILNQGATYEEMYFVVSGRVAVYVNNQQFGMIAQGSHFGTEAMQTAIRSFQQGTVMSPTPSAVDVKAVEPCECLTLRFKPSELFHKHVYTPSDGCSFSRCSALISDTDTMMRIVKGGVTKPVGVASPMSEQSTVGNTRAISLSPSSSESGTAGTAFGRARSDEDLVKELQAKRDLLVQKIEAAKLTAKKEELESQIMKLSSGSNNHGSSTNGRPPGGIAKSQSTEDLAVLRDRTAVTEARSDLIEDKVNMDADSIGDLPAPPGHLKEAIEHRRVLAPPPLRKALRRSSSENNLSSPRARLLETPDQDAEANKRQQEEAMRAQLTVLREKLLLMQQAAVIPNPASPPFQNKGAISPLHGSSRHIHPVLRAHIPLPRTEGPSSPPPRTMAYASVSKDIERDRHKWGPVWENSHYFNHKVYVKNVPKKGIPVDTNGDGTVDSLAVDFSGDGKVDTLVSGVQEVILSPYFNETSSGVATLKKPPSSNSLSSLIYSAASHLQIAQTGSRPR